MTGYGLDPDALKLTAKGITDSIAELKTLGVDGSAVVGRGFSGLALRGMQVGNAGLQQAFDQFCERWAWGVRSLVHDGNQIAEDLHLTAGAYYEVEKYNEGVLKDLTASFMGDPHQTDEQVEKKSWNQVLDDNPINQALHPDFSVQSAQKATQHVEADLKAEVRDWAEGPMGMHKHLQEAMGHGADYQRSEDAVLGPAPKNNQGGEGRG